MPAHNKDLEGMIDIDIGIEKYRENGDKYLYIAGIIEKDELGFYIYSSLPEDFPNFKKKKYYIEIGDTLQISNPDRLFDLKRIKYKGDKRQAKRREVIKKIFFRGRASIRPI